jgi:hypothetical protein
MQKPANSSSHANPVGVPALRLISMSAELSFFTDTLKSNDEPRRVLTRRLDDDVIRSGLRVRRDVAIANAAPPPPLWDR